MTAKLLSRRVITERGCWEYQGWRHERGYGLVRIAGKKTRVHRLAFTLSATAKGTSMLTRFENWPELLNEAIDEHAYKRFSLGSNDCVLFASNVILAMTGVDLAAHVRGQYQGPHGAFKLAGGMLSEVVSVIAKANGMPVIGPRMANRGDLVGFDETYTALNMSFGIAMGKDILGVAASGLGRIPMSRAVCAWRVG